jgi:hypothetical protein
LSRFTSSTGTPPLLKTTEPGDRVGSEITYQVSRGNGAETPEPPDPVKAEIQPGDGLPTGSSKSSPLILAPKKKIGRRSGRTD